MSPEPNPRAGERLRFQATTAETFCLHYCNARLHSARVHDATSPWHELCGHHPSASWYISEDHLSGFGLAPDGTLLGVWSLAKGRGTALMDAAVWRGASRLWCFDGYLVSFYARAGFTEVSRERNWTPGQPDVVHMVHPSNVSESSTQAGAVRPEHSA